MIDLADPEDPVEIARVELGAPPTDIVLDGDVAWVAVGAVQAYTSIAGAAPDTPTAIHTAVTTPTSAPPPVTATRAPAEPTPTAPPADPSLRLAIPWASSP